MFAGRSDYVCRSLQLQFSQDVGLGYLPSGEVTAGELWQKLESWYLGNGSLTYEDSGNGKTKAIWLEQSKAWDKNVKGSNQVVQRLLELFPKAKRDKRSNNQVIIRGLGFHSLTDPEPSQSSQIHSQLHSPEVPSHSQHSQPMQFSIVEGKNDLINQTPPTIAQVDWGDVEKIEEAPQTDYVGYLRKTEVQIEQETEANSTGYVLTDEVAMSDSETGYAEEYLESPEEDDEEVLEIGDRVVEILSGIKAVVVGFKDGRVVFDCLEFGRCSRPAIMLQKN